MSKRILPPIKEQDIIRIIHQYLTILENQGKIIFQRCNTGAMAIKDNSGKTRFFKFGKRGWPDFLIWKQQNYGKGAVAVTNEVAEYNFLETYFIEVKRDKSSKQSDDQKSFEKQITKLGGQYFIVKSLEEVQKILSRGRGRD